MKRLLSAVRAGSRRDRRRSRRRPIPRARSTIIVPNPPGGMNQITAQPLSAVIEKLTKQPAPVINKPGGTAAVGTAYVANQKPDGYNILVTTPNIYLVDREEQGAERRVAVQARADPAARADERRPADLRRADRVARTRSIKEFIADAKAKDGQLAYSSSGPFGDDATCRSRSSRTSTGLRMRHVPTTGGGPAVTQLLGGHVQATAAGPRGGRAAHQGRQAARRSRAGARSAIRTCPTCRRSRSSATTSKRICGSASSRPRACPSRRSKRCATSSAAR